MLAVWDDVGTYLNLCYIFDGTSMEISDGRPHPQSKGGGA
jgi:hypothetical protein